MLIDTDLVIPQADTHTRKSDTQTQLLRALGLYAQIHEW